MFQIHLADLDALIPKTSNLFCSGLAIALATEEALVCQRAEAAEEQGSEAKKAGASKGKVGVDASRLKGKDWKSIKWAAETIG
jgi:hypothetical protein